MMMEELTGREEADIELYEAICAKCDCKVCPYEDETENCPMIKDRYEYYD